jgi:ATP phosphoribosyltransferase
MLRVAVPNKGSLSEPAITMLREAGYRQRRARELVLVDDDNDTEFFFLRPRDIATYVGAGQLEVGITGRDLLLDGDSRRGGAAARLRRAPRSATRRPRHGDRAEDFAGQAHRHLATRARPPRPRQHGVDAEVIRLDGAVETAVRLGVADIIADVVETGAPCATPASRSLGEPILRSEAVLIRDARTDATVPPVEQLVRRSTASSSHAST